MAHIHIPEHIPVRYLPRAGSQRLLLGVAAAGAAVFLYLLSQDPVRAWHGYVVNWLYFTSLAIGATMFGVVTTIVRAKWNWSVKRAGLAFSAFLPISFVLFLPMLSLGADFFPWIGLIEAGDHVVEKKAAYLNLPFLRVRGVVGLLLLFGLLLYFVRLALRPDLGRPDVAEADGGDAGRRAWRERIAGGWMGSAAEEQRSWSRMTRMGPGIAIVFAVVMTFLAVDWAMSLDPHWFSTLFGWWFFMAAFWGGVALTAWTAVWLRGQHADLEQAIGQQQLHDLGKLSFAFTVFWTYLFWSQYIVIWYGKLPWEQHWMVVRSGEPWSGMSILTILLCFIVPFVTLISRAKMKPAVLRAGATVILTGLWLERYMLVAPSLRPDGPVAPWTELAIVPMFAALFIFAGRWFLETFPVVQVWKPPVEPEMVEAELPQPAVR